MIENNVVMNEYNMKVKEKKTKEDNEREYRSRYIKDKLIEEKQREDEQGKRKFEGQRRLNEKKIKKLIEKQNNVVLQKTKSCVFQMSEADNILTAREREIEKKEMEITLQHQKLIKNEKQLVVKITILGMAIQANQFRYFFLYLIKYKKCKLSFFQT